MKLAQARAELKLGKIRIEEAFETGQLSELAFDFAPIGLVVTENRIIRHCNPAFALMFGYAQSELVNQSFKPLYPSQADFVAIRTRGIADLRETNNYWDERVMARKDGALFWCRARGHTLTQQDPLARAVWSFADLSGHKPYLPLTPRERDVIGALAEGQTSKEIARTLSISPRTVEVYRARLHKKFGVPNTNALLSALSGVPQGNIVASA